MQPTWRGEIVQLSWSPRAYLLKGFLSDAEADHIIEHASPKMEKSTVVDRKTGGNVPSNIRTSTGTFFRQGQDDIVSRIEARVAQVRLATSMDTCPTCVPLACLQILRRQLRHAFQRQHASPVCSHLSLWCPAFCITCTHFTQPV